MITALHVCFTCLLLAYLVTNKIIVEGGFYDDGGRRVAHGMGVDRGFPFYRRVVWSECCAPSPEYVSFFYLKMAHFVAF